MAKHINANMNKIPKSKTIPILKQDHVPEANDNSKQITNVVTSCP